MKEITDHKLNGLNEAIDVYALEPGAGGAHTRYDIRWFSSALFPGVTLSLKIPFQNGPIKGPEDYNGITNEALLAVLIDRMRGFQSGPFRSDDNAMALSHLESALEKLQKRTRDRLARGVEGTHSL